jgi:hypothetical protein
MVIYMRDSLDFEFVFDVQIQRVDLSCICKKILMNGLNFKYKYSAEKHNQEDTRAL